MGSYLTVFKAKTCAKESVQTYKPKCFLLFLLINQASGSAQEAKHGSRIAILFAFLSARQ